MRHLLILLLASLSLNLLARESTLLDSGWQFFQGDGDLINEPIGRAEMVGTNWQAVSVPHCWGWQEAQAGKTNYRGAGWYRRELNITPQNGKHYFLKFEAASS